MPEVLRRQAGRAGDNWRVLFAIAQLAGGRWPGLVDQAARETVVRESKHTRVERLLASIWRAFHRLLDAETPGQNPQPYERLTSDELLDFLIGDNEETWCRADRGQPISKYWLRDNLRQLLDPPRTQ